MTTDLRGLPNNVISTIPASFSISSSTNASPIVVTASAPTGIVAGDAVLVSGHQGNTAANGVWIADTVGGGGTTIALRGSHGNGVSTASGTIRSLAVGADFFGPADNDDEDAASIIPSLETLADRTAFLWSAIARGFFQGGINATLTTATLQFIDTSFVSWQIPATLSGNLTIVVSPGINSVDYIEVFRAPSPDAHTVALSCAGGNTYGLAGSTAGWMHLRWDGTNWFSVGNGSGWTGTNVLV